MYKTHWIVITLCLVLAGACLLCMSCDAGVAGSPVIEVHPDIGMEDLSVASDMRLSCVYGLKCVETCADEVCVNACVNRSTYDLGQYVICVEAYCQQPYWAIQPWDSCWHDWAHNAQACLCHLLKCEGLGGDMGADACP